MNRIIKSLVLGTMLLTTIIALAGNVSVQWNASLSPDVNRYKVYALNGTNTFAIGNTNATKTLTVTNQLTTTFPNLASGPWKFVVTSVSTNGYESVNSNEISTNQLPDAPTSFRFNP